MYFPMEGWGPGTLWDELLERFDPDSVMFYRAPENMDIFKERYDPLECWNYKWMFHADRGDLPVRWSTPLHIAARAWAARPDRVPLAAIQSGAVEGGPESFHIVLAREFGRLGDEELNQIVTPGGRAQISPIRDTIRLTHEGAAARKVMALVRTERDISPRAWNLSGLVVLQSFGHEDWREGPIVVVGSTTADICLWLTLRTLRQSCTVWWWPDEMVPNRPSDDDDAGHGYTDGLVEAIYGHDQAVLAEEMEDSAYEQDPICVTSVSISEPELRARWQLIAQR